MRLGRRNHDDPADVEHLAWVNALNGDDQPVWRDPRNPAGQLLTAANAHDNTWFELEA